MVWRARRGAVDPARQLYGQERTAQPFMSAEESDRAYYERQAAVTGLTNQDQAESQAAYDNLVGRGIITAVERMGRVQSLASVAPPVTVVSYTVPENMLFRWCRLGFAYSDPMFHQLLLQTYLPWCCEVNQQPVPGLGEANTLAYAVGPGTVHNPMVFDPIWLQGGDVLAVVVRTLPSVTIELNVIARIGGWLHDRTGLRLGERV